MKYARMVFISGVFACIMAAKPLRKTMARWIRTVNTIWGTKLRKKQFSVTEDVSTHRRHTGSPNVSPFRWGEIEFMKGKKNRRFSILVTNGGVDPTDYRSPEDDVERITGSKKVTLAHELGHAIRMLSENDPHYRSISNFLADLSEIEYIKRHHPTIFSQFMRARSQDDFYKLTPLSSHQNELIIQQLLRYFPSSAERGKVVRRIIETLPTSRRAILKRIRYEMVNKAMKK